MRGRLFNRRLRRPRLNFSLGRAIHALIPLTYAVPLSFLGLGFTHFQSAIPTVFELCRTTALILSLVCAT